MSETVFDDIPVGDDEVADILLGQADSKRLDAAVLAMGPRLVTPWEWSLHSTLVDLGLVEGEVSKSHLTLRLRNVIPDQYRVRATDRGRAVYRVALNRREK